MSGLVGYGSSGEEDEIQLERPAKIAKISHPGPVLEEATDGAHSQDEGVIIGLPSQAPRHIDQDQRTRAGPQPQPSVEESTPLAEPRPEPSASTTNVPSAGNTPPSAPPSPYTYERQQLRELTMPTIPNFNIPDSPPPPPINSEEAATLAATTKRFERFLELKRMGVHFNERLQNTASLRNPSLLPKLMEFAGISVEESYANTLTGEIAVPTRWPEQCYVENLAKVNERREKKRVSERDRVEFVSATKSGSSSKTGTPKSIGEGRRSKFDKK